jgi:hypothetical protein
VQQVAVDYAGEPAAVADAYAKALAADGWKTEVVAHAVSETPRPGDPVTTITARNGHDRLRAVARITAKRDRTRIDVVFTPG